MVGSDSGSGSGSGPDLGSTDRLTSCRWTVCEGGRQNEHPYPPSDIHRERERERAIIRIRDHRRTQQRKQMRISTICLADYLNNSPIDIPLRMKCRC